MTIQTLDDAFLLKLKALYDIELQLVKALPKMAKAANDSKLKAVFRDHLAETRVHVDRIEEVFKLLNKKATKTKVEAIRGLVLDSEWIIKQKPEPLVLDAMLIASARYVEHYEMAGYISLIEWADLLGLTQISGILGKTLKEEQTADSLLMTLAKSDINSAAL